MSCVDEAKAMIQKRNKDHLKNADPRTEKATVASPNETRNCIATTQNRLVRVISTKGLHSGLMTHGKYSPGKIKDSIPDLPIVTLAEATATIPLGESTWTPVVRK